MTHGASRLIRRLFTVGAGLLLTFTAAAPGQSRSVAPPWNTKRLPFSFIYAGRSSRVFLPHWRRSQSEQPTTDGTLLRYTFTDPGTRLTVVAEVRTFHSFPGVADWVLRFRNEGSADTAILENILPLDFAFPSARGSVVLHHAGGSNGDANDFHPEDERIAPNGAVHLESTGGDSSNGSSLPFFNLQTGNNGVIGAIGWTGDWKAAFTRTRQTIGVTAGMKKTRLRLHPGEEIRSPRIVLMPWSGSRSGNNWLDAQNTWRRLLLADYTPQENGGPMHGPVLVGSWGSEPIADKFTYVRWLAANHISADLYTIDAGWFGGARGAELGSANPWWKYRGDWYPSTYYYPQGLKPLSDLLKKEGLGFSLWIEPETAMPGTRMLRDHPGWYLHSDHASPPGAALLNLGDPSVREGMTRIVSDILSTSGATWYRQDFNIRPTRYWEKDDAPDRIGMSQIHHIEGLYAMWDALLAAHPGLHIDNCASGGRRIDIETMARSYVVWRTDDGYADPIAEQAQALALAPWMPETMGFESASLAAPWAGPGPYATAANLYRMRLAYGTGFGIMPGKPGIQNDAWLSFIRQTIGEYREVQPYFLGDFYPVTPYSLSPSAWEVSQWNRPAQGDGVVIILRRPATPETIAYLSLKTIDPGSLYDVEFESGLEKSETQRIPGSDLARLQLAIPDAPGSMLVFYRRVPPPFLQ